MAKRKRNPVGAEAVQFKGKKVRAKTQWGFHRVEFSVKGIDRGRWHGFYWFTHQGGNRDPGPDIFDVARGRAGKKWRQLDAMSASMTRFVMPWRYETKSRWWWTVAGFQKYYLPIADFIEDAFLELYGDENVDVQYLEADYLNRIVYADDSQVAELKRGLFGW